MAQHDELTVTVVGLEGARADLTVTAARGCSVGDVLAVFRPVAEPLVGALSGPLLLDGRPLDPDVRWVASGVRHGSLLRLVAAPDPSPATFEVRVVAGPAAGSVHPLGPGGLLVGRSMTSDLVLDDDEVSRRHAEITVLPSGPVVRDLDSTNGVAVERVQVTGRTPLPIGAQLTIGECRLVVAPVRHDHAALDAGPGPSLVFHRPPRATPPADTTVEVAMPVAPAPPQRSRLPWVAVAVPIAIAGVMVAVMPSSPQFLLLLAMSPLMVVGNLLNDRRGGRRDHRLAQRAYDSAQRLANAAIAAACAADEQLRRAQAPDPADLLGRATLPSARLWERRASDPDALALRLGVADLPARVIPRPAPAADLELLSRDVPVVVSLDEIGVLGVAGDRQQTAALTRWLVGQSCVLLAPGDLSVVVLTTSGDAWSWLRWLPHALGSSSASSRVLVGLDPEGWARQAATVSEQLERPSGRRMLLVLDGCRELRQVPAVSALLAAAPSSRLRVLCRDAEERLLPQECTAVATFLAGSGSRLRLRLPDGSAVDDVLADQVDLGWAEAVGRALAGLDDVSERASSAAALPRSVRLLDLLGLPAPTAEAVAARWRQRPTGTSAVVGVGADGPLSLDLASDGPHALIAGMTGAGKSELLQTLVASLAVSHGPDALTFVLVDYKGGAAFRDCARLPHTVGLVTDLDGRLTERALASLSAELRRRERILADQGVADLEALLAATHHEPTPPLARLVIVIDEFATLVEELPEFVRGLVGIAQRGRSLGIHLVLATQRPGGVVSPDIRANTNLRICLRVNHAAESSDVVDSPEAALIDAGLAGRGLVRTGAGALAAFQAARVGGPAPSSTHAAGPTTVIALPLASLGERAPVAPAAPCEGPSDLSLLVDAACSAFAAEGRPAPRRPWLDPLPELVVVDEVPAGPYDLPLGVLDLPAEQARHPYGVRLGDPGHLMIVGTPRSGRSSALQTLAGSVARDWSPDDLHVYVLDFGNQALAPLEALPHCGAVVTRDQPDRLDRLLVRLSTELEYRQQVLTQGGFADLAEQRLLAPDHERLPWLVLLLDRWESFVAAHQEVDLGRRVDELLRLLREGPAVGLKAVITSDRTGLLGRLPSVVHERLVLRLADRSEYALADIPARDAPSAPPPGRGLVLGKGQGRVAREVQIALLASDPAGPAQLAALRGLVTAAAQKARVTPPRHRPLRVDPLPSAVTMQDVLRLGPTAAEAAGVWALIGVGGDQLAPVGVDLSADGPGFLVVGGPRSGRSTALLTMTSSLLRAGRPVCLVAPRRSPLSALASHPGVTGCLDATTSEELARQALRRSGAAPVVVVDDAEWLTDTAVGLVLEDELRAEPGSGAYVVAAGTTEDLQSTYRGFTVGLRRSRCGLLLNPQSSLDGELVGARLPRQLGSAGRHAGRALLAVRGELTPVQVART
ncbi:FtsK/SpoIIIE domain-containing protein [Acidothermaceae bacterium B102]|nr:FtsK/SpoIIIE domain-containing protein [Acidothermaceae bacterium B102]